MAISAEPTVVLSHLHHTDGSATFSQDGYTVIGAVNGPIEVSRRDELPEEAVVEVTVRPAAGVGGTRERHLESILQATLRQVIFIHNFPRRLIQITLQVTSTPDNDSVGSKIVQASVNLPILPSLLQTSVLTLLSASIPLAMTLTSILLAVTPDGILRSPTIKEIQGANSVHVLAFSSHGELLVAESDGIFTMDVWDDVHTVARRICCVETSANDSMQEDGLEEKAGGIMTFVKSVLQEKVNQDLNWKK
ncbi:hypothetical protein BJ878DRAFT_433620 [Calycina marina]|uniref:Exoribonuclease phosphorolytic domain-containing protein n=1 Tax=Calycina marina TaxID=1763456 RepID=A0A9P7ZB91_9HELO|nr:hypothetical protein BJ878DRAFT_433620 [Calycina marina]